MPTACPGSTLDLSYSSSPFLQTDSIPPLLKLEACNASLTPEVSLGLNVLVYFLISLVISSFVAFLPESIIDWDSTNLLTLNASP